MEDQRKLCKSCEELCKSREKEAYERGREDGAIGQLETDESFMETQFPKKIKEIARKERERIIKEIIRDLSWNKYANYIPARKVYGEIDRIIYFLKEKLAAEKEDTNSLKEE